MKALRFAAVLLAVATSLASTASAGSDAATQRIVIMSRLVEGRFVLVPSTTGALERDAGTVSVASGTTRNTMRAGQHVSVFPRAVYTFRGRLGSFTIRERTEWVEVSNVNTKYGYPPGVAIGTWTLVRGTGQYANLTGGGGSGHAGLGRPWLAQHEGLLTAR